jgi:hypothetical protein
MTRITKRFACLSLVAALAVPAGALAQDVAAPAAPAAEPAPAPVATELTPAPPAEPAPTLYEAPAATEETEPAPEDAAAPVAGWFRVDSDIGGLQLWAGATFPLSDTIGLATDIYVLDTFGSVGEFDIGPSITLAPGISILPMVGMVFNWSVQKAVSVVPQFYAYVDSSSVYFELWTQLFLSDMLTSGALDYLHIRAFPLYKVSDVFAIGVEIDANIAVANAPQTAEPGEEPEDVTLLWLPVGPHIKMNAGAASTIELFIGYDLGGNELYNLATYGGPTEEHRLAGRFTFVQTF